MPAMVGHIGSTQAASDKPVSTESIPTIEPQKGTSKTYSGLREDLTGIHFETNGEKILVESKFSAPDGKWYIGSNQFFKHQRNIFQHDNWIEVRDIFTNLTDENLPIMQVYSSKLGKRTKEVWLGCDKLPSGEGNVSESDNPSVFATTEKSGIGLLPLSDVFQIHANQSATGGTIELSDKSFVLKPKNQYVAEWAIVPVDKPDMWAFVNSARRLLRVNFRIDNTSGINAKTIINVNCFIYNGPEREELFKDARILDAEGNHMICGDTNNKLYVPTLNNAFGKETAKSIDIILDKTGANGIFWDEFQTSRDSYAYNMWDNFSADIDPETFKIKKLKGSVALLSLGWRMQQKMRIKDHSSISIKGTPSTRTERQLKMLGFTKIDDITNCNRMLLYTPVALGDSNTERTEKDAYGTMLKALDYGCLYLWNNAEIASTFKTLTEYMYPFTPIELHSGYVIGRERILTNKSGVFGWGDKSDFTAHVFDADGRETTSIQVPKVEKDDKTYAEVKIPDGHSVALVRIPASRKSVK